MEGERGKKSALYVKPTDTISTLPLIPAHPMGSMYSAYTPHYQQAALFLPPPPRAPGLTQHRQHRFVGIFRRYTGIAEATIDSNI